MRVARLFTDHPASIGETYGQHFAVACSFGGAMLRGGLACLLHAAFPFLCTSTGSSTVHRLHERMVVNRARPGEHRDHAAAAALSAKAPISR
ncbi:MAG: DUF6356 family protein [Xanthobacteraceae bacterium]